MKGRAAVADLQRRRPFRRAATGALHVITGTARRGAEVFAQDLAADLAARGRDVRVVALAGDPYASGATVPTLGPGRLAPSTLLALRRQARRSRVVVAHGSTAVVAAAIATTGTGVPFVYRNIGDTTHWFDTPAKRRRVRWIVRRAAAVVALWEASAAELRALGSAATRVEIIPTGTPASRFTPIEEAERREARAALGVDRDVIVAAYVGALSEEKNVSAAVEAVAEIPGARLLVVGDGPDREALERRARERAPDRVHFAGALDAPRDALAAADLLVLPSDTEGIPAALIEAAFAQLPVVATDVGGVGEIVVDGRTGVLVPKRPDPAVLATAVRKAAYERTSMGRAAREHCLERFELGVVAGRWDSLLGSLGAWDGAR